MSHSANGPSRANEGTGAPRINRKRYLNLNSDPNSKIYFDEKGNIISPSVAGHIRFTDNADDAPSDKPSGSKKRDRDRSQEPEPGHRGGKNGHQRGSGLEPFFKRVKFEDDILNLLAVLCIQDPSEEVPDSTCNSPELGMMILTSPTLEPSTSPTVVPDTRMSPQRRPSGSGSVKLFTQAVKATLPSGDAQTQKSKELREARETASKSQDDLRCMELRLQKTQEERNALKKRVAELEDRKENARHQRPSSQDNENPVQSLAVELEATKNSLQDLRQKLKEAQEVASSFEASGHRLNAKYKGLQAKHLELSNAASKTDRQVAALVQEKSALSAQLEALRHESKAKSQASQEPSMDVFSHRLDQVSEAFIKSGVDSLNDTLDNFVMEILEKSDQLVRKHAHLVRPLSEREHDAPLLLRSLAHPSLTDDNRGLLLDVQLHDQMNTELHELFFSNDVLPSRIEPDGIVQMISEELSRREPWTVVQRWRALTAMGTFALVNEGYFAESITRQTEDILDVLAQAYGLTPTQFEDMYDALLSGLRTMYKEANQLSVSVRRDILSVRMTVTTVSATHFNPTFACSVWPEMGAAAGDEIVGRYRFGLMKLTESGDCSHLIRPEVATTALIRETSKNS